MLGAVPIIFSNSSSTVDVEGLELRRAWGLLCGVVRKEEVSALKACSLGWEGGLPRGGDAWGVGDWGAELDLRSSADEGLSSVGTIRFSNSSSTVSLSRESVVCSSGGSSCRVPLDLKYVNVKRQQY